MGFVEKESKHKGCEYESHITAAHAQPNIFDKGNMVSVKGFMDRESREMTEGTNGKYDLKLKGR